MSLEIVARPGASQSGVPRAWRIPGRGPLGVAPWRADEQWSDSALATATRAFLVFGVVIRLVRFLRAHPLWGDECFLAVNLLGRSFSSLLEPLDYQQVCPLGFLSVELAAVKLLGFSELSLRLVPTACSVGSLFLLRHVAGRLMRGMPLLVTVAIGSVAFYPIRHGGEAKPYASDFLIALALIGMAVEWWRDPERPRWVWFLAAFAPLAVVMSHPSVFVAGGVALAIGPSIARGRKPRLIAAYLTFGATLVLSFLAMLWLYTSAQHAEVKVCMDHAWSAFFPPLESPPALLGWLAKVHTGHMFAYPVGETFGGSGVTFAGVVLAAVVLCRRGRSAVVGACVAPFGLALLASSLRKYPYGDNARVMQFLGPSIILLAGFGGAVMLGLLRRRGAYGRVSRGFLVAMFGLGAALVGLEVAGPGRSSQDLRAREFSRWFWAEMGADAEVACAISDLGLDFEATPSHHGRSAVYRCYQAMDFERQKRGKPLDWASISESRPLRVVIYDGVPEESVRFERWMAEMNRHYRLVDVETYRVNSGNAPMGVTYQDRLAVLDFEPIAEPVDPLELARRSIEAGRDDPPVLPWDE